MNYLQKELYTLIKEQDDIFDFLQQSSLDGLWYWDMEKPENEWMNSSFWKTLGYNPDDMPHKASAWQNIIFPEDGEAALKRAQEHFADPACPYDQEVRYHHKDGHTVWIRCRGLAIRDKNGKPIRMLGAHTDITDLKEREHELHKVKDLLEKSNQAARIGTWEVDMMYQKPYWSSVTKAIHEVDNDYEPKFETAINFFKEGESRELITNAVDKAIKEGKGYELDLQIITGLGNERWVRAIGVTEIENNECVRLYGTFQDIHDRKMAELELSALLEVTNDQNKRLLNFAHIVSHNLRSHSGNLSMTLGFLERDHSEEMKAEMMPLLRQSVDNLEETIRHLNEVVAINTQVNDSLQVLNLKKHLNGAIGNVQALLKTAGGEIINTLSGDVKVYAVPAYLDSVFLNLLTNSIKYRSKSRSLQIHLSFEQKGKQVVLSIVDNGIGIDLKRHGDKIFRMYKTFHNNKDARGIGLFITKNQVEAMGGKIKVESKVDHGTTFKIYLNQPD
ncbi:MAG: PAS domain-containing protein [Owenweeksia sp.]